MKKAVIFDMDGVIVFSESYYRQRRKLFFAQHDIPLTDEFQEKLVGSNSRDMFELLIEDVEKRKWLIEQYAEFRANYPIDYREIFNAEMVRTLEALANQGIRMAVASSSSLETIQMILTENQILSYFELLVSGDKFQRSKPNPEIYQYTVKKLDLTPDDCLVVEDSSIGISAAVNADLEVLALNNDDPAATVPIQSVSEVLKYIEL